MPVVDKLAQNFCVQTIDLPGLGASLVSDKVESLEQVAGWLVEEVDAPAIWLGWSLGGNIAMQVAAMAPEKVKALITVATNPSYVEKSDWQEAMASGVYQAFYDDVAAKGPAALARFLMLMVQGSTDARSLTRQLKPMIKSDHADRWQLLETLGLLEHDCRPLLDQVSAPQLHILGAKDPLVPASAYHATVKSYPDAQCELFEQSGHLPFLSEPDRFVAAVADFSGKVS